MTVKLIKLKLHSFFSSMTKRNGKKSSKGMTVLMAFLLIYAAIVFIGLSAFMFYTLASQLFPSGAHIAYFSFAAIAAFLLSFIGSIFFAEAQLFGATDNELLLSMPIKPSSILLSRMTVVALSNALFTAVILIPAFVVFQIFSRQSLLFLPFYILMFLSVTLFSFCFSCLFGYLAAFISSKIKRKNLFKTLTYFLFFFGYLAVYFNIQNILAGILSGADAIASFTKAYLYPIYSFSLACAELDFISLLANLLITAVLFTLSCFMLSKSFTKIVTAGKTPDKIKYKQRRLKAASPLKALVKKELRKFISTPLYMFNTFFGAILEIIFAVFLLIRPEILTQFSSVLPQDNPLPFLCCIALTFCASTCCTTSCALSLEGKNFQILRSLPFSPLQICIAKTTANIIIGTPTLLISAAMVSLSLKTDLIFSLLLFLLPMSAQIFTAVIGTAVNMAFPKLEWDNETVPIKQSASTAISMLISLIFLTAPVVLGFLLAPALGTASVILFSVLFYILCSLTVLLFIQKNCEKYFSRI